jgi:hypothetical protein
MTLYEMANSLMGIDRGHRKQIRPGT